MKDTAGILKEYDSGLADTRKKQLNFSWKQGKNNNKKGLGGAEKLLLWPFDLRNKVVVKKWGLVVRLRSAIEANCFFFFFPKCTTQKCDPHAVCISFLYIYIFFVLFCHGLLSSFLTSDFYRTQCKHKYFFRTMLECFLYARPFWCHLYAVIVRFKLFLSIRCLGWWISIFFFQIPRCWQPQLTREGYAEGFGLASL